jgi:polar amino acid transport system ATP-binding protein
MTSLGKDTADTPGGNAIEISGLHKSFGTNEVLRGIDFHVAPGEVVCVIGPSGSGKSTLLRCVNLLEEPSAGTIRVVGAEVTDPEVDIDAVRRRIGMVFQAFNLFPHLRVLENVVLAPVRAHGVPRAEAEARARELLERFGLEGREDVRPDRLSGGQQQRVAIIRALAGEPRALLLDEVTSALDPDLVGEVLGLLRELKESGMTMVIATHEMSFAREVADRVDFLHEGRIVESGPPSQLLEAPSHPETQRFLRRLLAGGRL